MLELRNRQLLHEIERLIQEIDSSKTLAEIGPYRTRIRALCLAIKERIQRNLNDLDLGQNSILEDILSNTQQVTQHVRLLSSRLVTPILRSSSTDRFCLRVIAWLHTKHPSTAKYPAAFTDGDCAIWPFLDINPIYFFPASEQRGVLYLPLYFHEFGHLLYACHRQEMDDLVRDLQQHVDDILVPTSQRGDRHSLVQADRRRAIVMTWYKWAQELFCDAVGLTIGGPAFLSAFSSYLSTLDRGDFYRPLIELGGSGHPVTLLRIRMLTRKAQQMGFSAESEAILKEWEVVRNAMGIAEDYHGYYTIELLDHLDETIRDMLIEGAPVVFQSSDPSLKEHMVTPTDSPVVLVNKAWKAFTTKPVSQYMEWERQAMESWLK
ncbi:hypothetical protein [Dehalococcoides mccartyi]|uniref:hypothetical protein n=1 Tax=Dehalococcoides mccartyi TaxID=61435 RepID=UPI0002B76102|nr:hypothetical protein [Dehalococcoides mccartyi]AGG05940.1 hypothetical protein dcmb_309 [Dehalococcoides mccartyi DCMB5]